jgi:hypothetical protein
MSPLLSRDVSFQRGHYQSWFPVYTALRCANNCCLTMDGAMIGPLLDPS